jgi:hypothetical protein
MLNEHATDSTPSLLGLGVLVRSWDRSVEGCLCTLPKNPGCVCRPSQNGTTDSHRDRGLRSGLVRDTRRRATREESVMGNCTRYLVLDVHAETITAAIAEERGRVRTLGRFPNRPEAVRKLIEKLGGSKNLKVCYEAGPTGYALYWQLTNLGVDCEVIAPSLIPKKAGDQVKTDRRDAEKLAQSYQAGDPRRSGCHRQSTNPCVIWSAAPLPRPTRVAPSTAWSSICSVAVCASPTRAEHGRIYGDAGSSRSSSTTKPSKSRSPTVSPRSCTCAMPISCDPAARFRPLDDTTVSLRRDRQVQRLSGQHPPSGAAATHKDKSSASILVRA